MTPLPDFDLYYPDGLAMIDLAERIDLEAAHQSRSNRYGALIDKLTRAVTDIELLKQGWRPTPETLATAPILSDWTFYGSCSPGATSLHGIVIGHPRISEGASCTTSVLLAIDTANWAWARTVSRFYQLRGSTELLSPH